MSHVSELLMKSAFQRFLFDQSEWWIFLIVSKNIKDFYFNFEILEGELFLLCKKVLEMLSRTQF